MPVEVWECMFSPASPDLKTKTFFEGQTKYYLMIERSNIQGQGKSPAVNIAIQNGGSTNNIDLPEGDRQYHEGNACHGICVASNRSPNETVRTHVAVTWQQTPF
jgi:hypothetical protein